MDLSLIDLPTETIRTERLVLRPFSEADVPAVLAACQDPGIQRWISALPVPYTEADARSFITEVAIEGRASGQSLTVAIEADGRLVGASGLNAMRIHPLGPEIGYWIAAEARGHGYAAETTSALAEWALGLGAPRVHLVADVRNAPSQAVARAAGFTQEGVLRSYIAYRDGSRGDAAVFSRLPDD